MNNYSWLQQKLHQIALSSNFMRKATFDVESSAISIEKQNDKHVFVAGLARSGTTALLNALYQSEEFASICYGDMPFVLAPNLWSKLALNKQDVNLMERAHGDGIKISIDAPEAFEEVFWMTFNEGQKETKEKFINYVQLINQRYKKQRYLSKNNQNIRRLALISDIFPQSNILVPYRNPIQQAYSLHTQHQKFIEISKKNKFIAQYMKLIGHTEFGVNYVPLQNKNLFFENHVDINHWLEQWFLVYLDCYETLKKRKNVHFICYEQLCSQKGYWIDILGRLDVKTPYDFDFKVSAKEISIDINHSISDCGLSLYNELKNLSLQK